MKRRGLPVMLLAAGLATGCGKAGQQGAADEPTAMHQAVPPHGGVPIALGEDYSLELVRDRATGTLSAYVLDDDLENFIRIGQPSLTVEIRVGANSPAIVLAAVGNPATGETAGSTSLFQGRADWLKSADPFTGTIRSITIRGSTFRSVGFTFPAGNEKD